MRIFVYGTLKRGYRLHHHLTGQTFVGEARTVPAYRLFRIDWFPALVDASEGQAIHGEVWEVDAAGLIELDAVEEVHDGLYERRRIQLQPPFDRELVEAYFYLRDVSGSEDCGPSW